MGGLFLLVLLLFALFLLFFPIYIELDAHYQAKDKKIGIAVYLYRRIKIIGGYLDSYPGGFAFHTKTDKVILMPINDREGQKKQLSIFRRFRLSDLAITTETGADYLPLTILLNEFFKGYYMWQGGHLKGYQSDIWLRNGEKFSMTVNALVRINLYMQICVMIKKCKEKWICKKKIRQ